MSRVNSPQLRNIDVVANLKDVVAKRPGEEVSTREIVRAKRVYVLFCICFEQIMYLNILLRIEKSLCTMKIASEDPPQRATNFLFIHLVRSDRRAV